MKRQVVNAGRAARQPALAFLSGWPKLQELKARSKSLKCDRTDSAEIEFHATQKGIVTSAACIAHFLLTLTGSILHVYFS